MEVVAGVPEDAIASSPVCHRRGTISEFGHPAVLPPDRPVADVSNRLVRRTG